MSTAARLAVDLTSYDVFVAGIPHEFFAEKRREEPVFWHPDRPAIRGFWCVTKHDDLVAVHKNPETFSSEVGQVRIEDLEADEIEARKSMLETDPPRHSRLRRIVSGYFTPRAVVQYEDYARELARDVLSRALRAREFDFVDEIAAPFPINVLVRILGAPAEDAPMLIELGNRMIAKEDPEYSGADEEDASAYRLLPFASPAAVELIEYGDYLAAKRREQPEDDLVTKLVHAEVDGERLTEAEFANFFALLVIAGNETTRQAITHGVLALAEHPEQMHELAGDRSLSAAATEEVLRFATPVFYFRRTATVDTEIRGVRVHAGDKVVNWYISANFDEDVFEDPYRFDIRREPNEHVTFGKAGPHHCLGAYLARLEIRVMLEELLPRVAGVKLAGPVSRVRSNFINGIKHVPVRVELAS
jgi:cytochrome P450